MALEDILARQREFFSTHATKDLAFRKRQLTALRTAILRHEEDVCEALREDLGKCAFESFVSELAFSLSETEHALGNLDAWARPEKVGTPPALLPAESSIVPEPYGVSLILAPWNYPFSLTIAPLVGAIAAGNCAVVKPSELAPHTSRAIAEILGESFDPAYIAAVEGGADVAQELLAMRWDKLFYTGGSRVGKVVMKAAAEHLTPVTLELGGKSPCIIHEDADIAKTAKRVMWGKCFNAGQTCVAPDYLLVQESIVEELLPALKAAVREFYSANPQQSPDYGRIVNDAHFERIASLLKGEKVLAGGRMDAAERYIEPTIVSGKDSKLMQDEIFGPVLPLLTYATLDDAIAFVNRRDKPLSLYVFSRSAAVQERVIAETSSGGVCVNDTLVQYNNTALPFGGVGPSGLGAYHGKASFDAFSHRKSVMNRSLIENEMRYPPYQDKVLALLKRFRKLLG